MRNWISVCLLISGCFLGACDKSDKTPPTSAPSPILMPPPNNHPTTAQLEKSPRKSVSLMQAPLSVSAPDGWVVKTIGQGDGLIYMLYGPTPSDDISFHIAAMRSLDELEEKKLESSANLAMKTYPNLLGDPVVREIAGGKVIEQLTVNSAASTTQTTAPAGIPPSIVEWNYTVIVPSGNRFAAYDLTADLTMKQYMIDRAFIRSIMETLTIK